MINIISVVISFLITYFIIPIIMKISLKIGFTDKPTKRKKHRGDIPLCGGIGIYIGFFITYLIISIAIGRSGVWYSFKEQIAIFIGSTLILGIGLIDDYYKSKHKEFPIYPRLIIQVLAAIIVYSAGIVFTGINNPFGGGYIMLSEWAQFLLTVTWIFGVTTVINWSDGMDGLAGGISIISSVTFFIVAIILGQSESALISITLAAAILGFFLHNKYPAKVFMGDSGANLIGYLLAIIAIDGAFKQTTVMSIFIPILALAVPIFDNIFVIFKRFFEGKPVYQADRSQVHFRLAEKGMSTKQIVLYILLISSLFSFISIVLLLIK